MNSTERSGPWPNSSTWLSTRSPSGLGLSVFTMTFGAVSNLTALCILAKAHIPFRRRSKAPFLLLTVALLLADLGGHTIPGAFALYVHLGQRNELPNKAFCQIFGASLVFFGLCPLLLGCAMALERCVAITWPFFHTAVITVGHVRRVVLFLFTLALMLAVLPLFEVGNYTIQFPGTWCFLQIHDPTSTDSSNLALAFSCLGLTALTLSLLCNILCGWALLQARMKSQSVDTNRCSIRRTSSASSSLVCSLNMEMIVQLAVITAISCVCWSPFLIHILLMQLHQTPAGPAPHPDGFILLALRMASWNQILDPWVYILLRRSVLFRLCCAFYSQQPTEANSFQAESHRRRLSSV